MYVNALRQTSQYSGRTNNDNEEERRKYSSCVNSTEMVIINTFINSMISRASPRIGSGNINRLSIIAGYAIRVARRRVGTQNSDRRCGIVSNQFH